MKKKLYNMDACCALKDIMNYRKIEVLLVVPLSKTLILCLVLFFKPGSVLT